MATYFEVGQALSGYNSTAAPRGLPQIPRSYVLERCGVAEKAFLADCDAVRQGRTPPALGPDAEAMAAAVLRELTDKTAAALSGRGNGADARSDAAGGVTGALNVTQANQTTGAVPLPAIIGTLNVVQADQILIGRASVRVPPHPNDELDLDDLSRGGQTAFGVLENLCKADPLYVMKNNDCFNAVRRLYFNEAKRNAWLVLKASLQSAGVKVRELAGAFRRTADAEVEAGTEAGAEPYPDDLERDREGLTKGLFWRDGGALYIRIGKGDNTSDLRLCSDMRAVRVESDVASRGWSVTVEVTDQRGGLKEVSFSQADSATDPSAVIRKLTDAGLVLYVDDPRHHRLILRAVRLAEVPFATCTDESGWNHYDNGESFVFSYQGGAIGCSKEPIVWRGDGRFGRASQEGTDASWRETILKRIDGNPIVMACLGVALSSPAIPFQPAGAEKNTMVNLVGDQRTGKTTSLRVAATIAGRGGGTSDPRSFVESLNTTLGNIEAVLAASRHIGFIIDEVRTADAALADRLALIYGSGHGKGRLNRDSKAKDWKTWETNGLMSGEKTLGEHAEDRALRRNTRDAGEESRIINIPVPESGVFEDLHGSASPAVFAEDLAAACVENYGFALPAFVEHLAFNGDAARRKIGENFVAWNVLSGALLGELHSSQSERVARRLGRMAAAAALAAEVLSFPWKGDIDRLKGKFTEAEIAEFEALDPAALAMLQAFAKLLDLWIKLNGVEVNTQVNEAFAELRAYYHGAPPAAFVITGTGIGGGPAITLPTQSSLAAIIGWKVMSGMTTKLDGFNNLSLKGGKLEHVDFNADVLKKKLFNRTVSNQVFSALRNTGYLVPPKSSDEFAQQRRWQGLKIRVFRVRASFFGEVDDGVDDIGEGENEVGDEDR